MTRAAAVVQRRHLERAAPTIVAGAFAIAYVLISPPSLDLPAHLLRAKLFSVEGFGIWNNWWYAGHHVVMYSVLFPPIASALSPQLAAAIAAVGTAALFEPLARRHFGEKAWLGALWFGAATATNLFTGRLTFAFGLLPAVASALALQRRRPGPAALLAVLTALCSPVAALFAATAGAAHALGSYTATRAPRAAGPGVGVVVASLAPVGLLALAFPEGGHEPFAFSTFWPILVIAVAAIALIRKDERILIAGIALYAAGCIVAFAVPTAVGSNAARLTELAAGPLAALLLWPRRKALLLAAALPLLYVQWHAPVRDVSNASWDQSRAAAYYRPLLSFLGRESGPAHPGPAHPPFRVEIPFTAFHWEAFEVAPRFPLARGWERQLDIQYNQLFYGGALTAATYEAWLHRLAVRFVAVPDTRLDYAGVNEAALIDRGLPYLHLVFRTPHWRVYSVLGATPIAQGAQLLAIGANSLTLRAAHPGSALVRVRFTPYWAITEGSGCVAPDGGYTRVTIRRPGVVKVTISFSLGRIRASSPRCN
jgi:hypothetical protein